MKIKKALYGCVACLLLAACGDDSGTDPGINVERPECENLNPSNCLLPWPSMRFLEADPSTDTGFRVALTVAAMPLNMRGEEISNVGLWNRFDGFSPMSTMVTSFAGDVDPADLPDESRIGESILPGSPTVVIDADTLEWVPHFSELDLWPEGDPERRTLYIRPAQRLKENQRYIVAVRGLTLVSGEPVQPWPYFAVLRDGVSTGIGEVEDRRARFEEIFGLLGSAGVGREDLLEAWEFHTASGPSLWGEMVWLRDDACARVGDRGLGCTVLSVEDDVNAQIWRRVRGTFTVPLYMTSDQPGSVANRDGEGRIAFNDWAEAPFELVIPISARDHVQAGGAPVRFVMYGHGMLSSSEEVSSSGARHAFQSLSMVAVGTDYWGLCETDGTNFVTNVLTNFGNFDQVSEKLLQGTVNSLVLARSFKGVCAELPELRVDVAGTPTTVMDATTMYYYGISMGGTQGTTFAALTTDIDRFVMHAGGSAYTYMMRRSTEFDLIENAVRTVFPDPLDRHVMVAALQTPWDLAEPTTYAPHLLSDPLPGSTVSPIGLRGLRPGQRRAHSPGFGEVRRRERCPRGPALHRRGDRPVGRLLSSRR
jgi:hypothetical protein